ncbi:MAG: hypothetical protein PHC43_01135 [Candidatus Marinimicrobia bacterium]|jgi:hypothetical protein|nr:hypothetical protein [Candidatus Neomarinimicrobiota bacterium]
MATAGFNVKIVGTKQIIENLRKAGSRGVKAVAGGLYLGANNIMRDSKKEVPVDLGTLKNSGYVTMPEISGDNVKVELGYGGEAKDYAVVQHEHTEFKHPEGGKAKFLQDPLYAAAGGFAKNVTHFAKKLFDANQGVQKTGMPESPK